MKVLLITITDHAHMAYMTAEALKKLGVDAVTIRKRTVKFKYPEEGIKIRTDSYIKPYAENADVIIFMHTQYRDIGIDLTKKKVLVWHTGSGYRQKFEKYNAHFNPIVDVSLCSADLLGLGAKNERCLNGLVNTDLLQPIYGRKNKKITIAHYSASPKGIIIIKKAIHHLKQGPLKDLFIFRYSAKKKTWDDNIKRMAECDIYIAEMHEKQIKKGQEWTTGMFGIAALEAAALGKIVISRFIYREDCEGFDFGLQVANNLDELIKKLEYLLSLSEEKFLKLRKLSRDWVVNCHSYEAVGYRLLKIIEGI